MSGPDDLAEGAFERRLGDGSKGRLVREEPLVIAVRDQSVLTMRTPGRDADLAVGFLLTEGVASSAADVELVEERAGDAALLRADRVEVTLARAASARITGRLTRTHEIRSSCGICGLVDADELLEDLPPLLPGVPRLGRDAIEGLLARFTQRQDLFHATGGCHAAAVCDEELAFAGFGEDVGRHNALDKAIGQAARAGHELARCVAVLSGRAGFDLVLKCLRVRIPVIVSVSAASALSFDVCAAAGATLVGFARGDRCRVYLDGGRLD